MVALPTSGGCGQLAEQGAKPRESGRVRAVLVVDPGEGGDVVSGMELSEEGGVGGGAAVASGRLHEDDDGMLALAGGESLEGEAGLVDGAEAIGAHDDR